MAEFAELYVQATVAEVEEIERIGLLNKKEIRVMIEKRREFEYRLARRSKDKEDFINSINYEKKLLQLLKIRRKQMQVFDKKKEIEGAINLRSMKRCRFLTRYWPNHRDTWALRINFAQFIGWKGEISVAYAEQIHHHGNLESVYILWARFEIEQRENFDTARKILLSKAALYHSKSLLIKRELFRLELMYVQSLKKMLQEDKAITEVIEENREKVLQCEIPRAVYKNAVHDIADPQLYVELYQVADKFDFAHDIREDIYKDLADAFPNSECVWKLKAQRIVMGIEPKDGEDEPSRKLLAVDKLNSTIWVYDCALKAVGPSFLVTYIEELMLMLHACWSNTTLMKVILDKMIKLFNSDKSSLLPLHYIIWFHIVEMGCDSSNDMDSFLEMALKVIPDAAPFRLVSYKRRLKSNKTYTANMKEFKKMVPSLKGRFGIEMFELVVQYISDRKNKIEHFLSGCNHSDDTIAKEFRLRYLEWLNSHRPVKFSRQMYKQYRLMQPFSARLHALMVFGELTKRLGNVECARPIFENAIGHHGKIHPGLWLTYIYFEKYSGNPLKAGALYTRAEKELDAEQAEVFRELNAMLSERLTKPEDSLKQKTIGLHNSTEKSTEIWVVGNDHEKDNTEQKLPIICLFEEALPLTYTDDKKRNAFYASIRDMKELFETGYHAIHHKDDGSEWEDVMKVLIGEKVPLVIQQVKVKKEQQALEEPSKKSRTTKPKRKHNPTQHLDPGTGGVVSNGGVGHIGKILESSLTLKPEFLQKTQLDPYIVSKAKAKADRKKERAKTAGPGWFDMKAPEMTEELKRDMEILKMRPLLDPKRPFKNKDMQVVPKNFQMGKIMDSPVDFYSSRIPNKKRKRTMAEEILNDEEVLRHHKIKLSGLIAKKQKRQHKHSSNYGGNVTKTKKLRAARKY